MKTGIITGAGKGIGLSTLELLLNQKDYKVISITRSKSNKIKKLLKKKNYLENYYHNLGDDLNRDKELINKIIKKYKIDFMICNAGVRHRDSIQNMDYNKRKKTLDINYNSNVILIEEVLKNLGKINRKVNIVYISSIVGNFGFKNLSSYSSSKMAMEGFIRSAAVEYAPRKIRINIVAPGFIKSSFYRNFLSNQKKLNSWILNRTPMKRWGEPKEIASTIEFLISDKSSYITGSTIFVDGGWNIS